MVVSGLFADAVAGFLSRSPGTTRSLWSTQSFAKMRRFDRAMSFPATVRSQILDDLGTVYDDWQRSALSVEFEEFMYFQQRQPKAFGPLLGLYRRLVPVSTPYLDRELIDLFLSCPFELRREKRVSRALLQRRDPVLADLPDVSSAFSTVNATTRMRRVLSTWSARAAAQRSLLTKFENWPTAASTPPRKPCTMV